MKKAFVFLFLLLLVFNSYSQTRSDRMAWWEEAKFGMFIHWGVYAVPAGTYNGKQVDGIGEWIMNRGKIPVAKYKSYAQHFNLMSDDTKSM